MITLLMLTFIFALSGCKTLPPSTEMDSPEKIIEKTMSVLPAKDEEPEKPSLDISGVWHGELEVGSLALLMEFSFSQIVQDQTTWMAVLNIPQQMAYEIPITRTEFDGTYLFLDMTTIQATYSATVEETDEEIVISGTYTQGASLPLVLRKKEATSTPLRKHQEPIPPYPYVSEEISITTQEDFLLGATITRPDDGLKHPAVILISGSGQQDRDETIFGHKPFKVIADSLTRSGFIVVRADDRGVGTSGGGATLSQATTRDFARDAEAILDHTLSLESVDSSAVGLIGHSEGALITVMVAARRQDVAFIILLNGPGIIGKDLILAQSREIMKAQGFPEATIMAASEINNAIYSTAVDPSLSQKEKADSIRHRLLAVGMGEDEADAQIATLLSPWYVTFLSLDPQDYLPEISIPVFIVSGGKDIQVPSSLNVTALNDGLLKSRATVSIGIYPEMNHILQPATTGLPMEYPLLETTVLPDLLDDMASWLGSITN
ncbi:alpha/beta hydrolase family protein [Parasphaerochaeta coccoides]|nr:alpha/beta hydrolase [Parasphaerochaeta coccoides]